MMRRRFIQFLVSLFVTVVLFAGPTKADVLFWAPGYPGDTEQAQETMERFASALSEETGQKMSATYHADLEGGLAALKSGKFDWAIVTLPVFYEYRSQFQRLPALQAEPLAGAQERWSLVAGKGLLSKPADLKNWKVVSTAGFSEDFVKYALKGWGAMPDAVAIDFSGRARSFLREAAKGEPVAVLLDGAQSAALPSLRYAADLEVVFRSPELPSNVVCEVGQGLSQDERQKFSSALLKLAKSKKHAPLLEEMRLAGFSNIQPGTLNVLKALHAQQ